MSSVRSADDELLLPGIRSNPWYLLWSGALSATAYWTQNVGQVWLVLHSGGTPMDLGALSAFQYGPYVLLGFKGADIAENVPNKKYALQLSQLALSLMSFFLAIVVGLDIFSTYLLFLAAAVSSLANTIGKPSRQALTANVAGGKKLKGIVGINSAVNYTIRIGVPAITGLIISQLPMYYLFAFTAVCYIGSLILIQLLQISSDPSDCDRNSKLERGALRGLNYIQGTPILRNALLKLTVMTVFPFSFNIFIPILAKQNFGLAATGYGTMLSAMALGAVAGSLFISRVGLDSRKATLGAATAVGLLELFLIYADNLYLTYLCLFFCGASVATFLVNCNATFLQFAPGGMRARVAGMYDYVASGIGPLGSGLVSVLIGMLGISPVLAFCSLCALAVAFLEYRTTPART